MELDKAHTHTQQIQATAPVHKNGNGNGRSAVDKVNLLAVILTALGMLAVAWVFSLDVSKEMNNNYAQINNKLSILYEKVDGLTKGNEAFESFKEDVKERAAKHETKSALIEQDIMQIRREIEILKDIKSKERRGYNDFPE